MEIKDEWLIYYEALESIRESGIVNMYGAAPYLAKIFDIDKKLAQNILANWMHNYSALAKQYKWR